MSKPKARYRLRFHFCVFLNGKRVFDKNIPIGKIERKVQCQQEKGKFSGAE